MDYSITKYTGSLESGGGPAFKNRYFVKFAMPPKLSGSGADLDEMNLFCDVAFIPSHRVVTDDYSIMTNPLRIPYSFTTEELSFTFQLTHNHKIRELFEEWSQLIVDPKTYEVAYKEEIVADSWEVWQTGKDNEKSSGIRLINVMLIQTSSVDFSNSEGGVQSFSVTIAYDRREKIAGGASSGVSDGPLGDFMDNIFSSGLDGLSGGDAGGLLSGVMGSVPAIPSVSALGEQIASQLIPASFNGVLPQNQMDSLSSALSPAASEALNSLTTLQQRQPLSETGLSPSERSQLDQMTQEALTSLDVPSISEAGLSSSERAQLDQMTQEATYL